MAASLSTTVCLYTYMVLKTVSVPTFT